MKKFLTTLLAGLVLCAMLVTCATAVDDEDGIGIWAVFDESGEFVDLMNAFVLGNGGGGYVLTINENTNAYLDNTYFFFAPEINGEIEATLVDDDTLEIGGYQPIGLFELDDDGEVYETGIYSDSESYTGTAHLLYIDVDAMDDDVEEISDMMRYRKIVSITVTKSEDGMLYLSGVPNNVPEGAAVLSKDEYLFLGSYAGTDRYGDYAVSAETLVDTFPSLSSFIVSATRTQTQSDTTRSTSGSSQTQEQTDKTTKSDNSSEKKKSDDKDDDKGLSRQNVILLAVLAVLLIGGGAAFLIVRSKKSGSSAGAANYYPQGGSGTDIPLQNGGYLAAQPEQAGYPLPQIPGAYNDMNAPQSPVGGMYNETSQATINMEQTMTNPMPAAPDAGRAQVYESPDNTAVGAAAPVAAPDAGQAYVFTAPENMAIGATVPVAPMQPPICIVGKGGRFAGQSIREQDVMVIGRQKERCTLCYPVDEKGISSVHCRLSRNNSQLELMDCGSTYGTFLNGAKLTPNVPVALHSGDTFYLADPINSFTVTD